MKASKGGEEKARMWVRNWKNYSPSILQEKLASVEWNIACSKVQDYNDELEQKIMTVLEEIIPFQWRALGRRKMEDSPRVARLKRKKKNILTNAKRRGSKELT